MPSSRAAIRISIALAGLLLGPPIVAAEEQVQVGRGVGFLNVPSGANVGAVLVSGSGGMSPNDLLMRSRHLFERQGVATLMIANDNSPLRAVELLRQYVPRVSLVAMSAGTLSAARAVANGARPNSLVLISGFLTPTEVSGSVSSIVGRPGTLPPTLVIHNRQEECERTPASGVAPFIAWSRGRAQGMWVASGSMGRNPCGPLNFHGFPGSEDAVMQAAGQFVSRY
ncbi:hypothetical protein [Salinarimonas soli]|uniref:Alpha/beta hydrolase n=1 Tax=Salinarimonas soli TaxID=1638099 RepID=A0A5B2V8W2_9HYPH|nr:hypothetical protein [Salinarimonas soli]KAA2235188.1 hypothetical protein F0L46_20805 [Salinarimonas soli]